MTSNNVGADDMLVLEQVTVDVETAVILDNIDLRVKRCDIHAIIGDHGAGKSTLVNVISGMIPRTRGKIVFDHRTLGKHTAKHAIKLGITTVYQEGTLLQNMTALENIFLNREQRKYLFFADDAAMRKRALDIFAELDIPLNPNIPLKSYNVAQQHLVELARIVCFPSKLLIIDEMSSKLLPKDIEKLHYILSMLRQGGTTILYVSGDMDEIFNFANRVTILNKGRVVETTDISNIDKIRLVQLTYSSMYSRERLEKSNLELFYLNNFQRSILQNIPIPMLVADSKGAIVLMNTMFAALSHLRPADFLGQSVHEVFDGPALEPRHDRDAYQAQKVRLRAGAHSYHGDLHVLPFVDDDDSFMGTIYLLKASGDQADFEHYLRHALPASDSQKKLAEIAHEINNPLGIMLNYLRLIKTSHSPDHVQRHAEIIEKEIKRIKRILKNLSDVHEESPPLTGKTCVRDAIDEVALLLQPMMTSHHIHVESTGDSDIWVSAEPDLLKQIVLNIMLNGIEAMPDGGDLTVRIGRGTLHDQEHVVIEIRDTGVGIPANALEKIFEPFYTTKDATESRGLGLSLCQDLITQLRGLITVESHEQRGTTFRVFLPHVA